MHNTIINNLISLISPQATLLACIVADPKRAFADDALLAKFTALNVELDFVRQVNAPFARTLNKFSAFYRANAFTSRSRSSGSSSSSAIALDQARFDHFLWLDADVFVLSDPMPLLRSLGDLQEGKIYCVPEVRGAVTERQRDAGRQIGRQTGC